ncbi:recombinase family protein [Faecalibacterium taiwanense]|uniref:recombinase family protein n=1 Tax=Faecalibacterium taiwanense TaxID=3030638 RepID=UPI003AAFE783
MSIIQTEDKITALYERLSRDDDQIGDSNSIVNQRRYLEGYCAQQGYTNFAHYTDDAFSGGTFERPAWKKLVADIEAGKVARVIVKDMSRIGRDDCRPAFTRRLCSVSMAFILLPSPTAWTATTNSSQLPRSRHYQRVVLA